MAELQARSKTLTHSVHEAEKVKRRMEAQVDGLLVEKAHLQAEKDRLQADVEALLDILGPCAADTGALKTTIGAFVKYMAPPSDTSQQQEDPLRLQLRRTPTGNRAALERLWQRDGSR